MTRYVRTEHSAWHAVSVQPVSVLTVFIIIALPLPACLTGTLSTGARKTEIPVRRNTIRPVSLCSLWGQGGVSQGLGGALGYPGWRCKPDATTDPGRKEIEGSPNIHLVGIGA